MANTLGSAFVTVSFQGIADQISKQINEGVDQSGVANPTNNPVGEGVGQGVGEGTKSGLGKAGPAILGMIAAMGIGELISSQISGAMDSQNASAKLAAGLALSPDDRAKVEASVDDLFAGAYGGSKEEISATMNSIMGSIKGAREMSSEELTAMGKDFSNLSATYGLESEGIAVAAQSFINNGLGSWEDFADLTAKAYANLGEAGAADFLDVIKEYSGDLKTSGLDTTEAFNLFNNAIKSGFYDTDKLMDMMRETGIRVRDGSADETLAAFGFDPAQIKAAAEAGGDEWQTAWGAVLDKVSKEGSAADLAGITGTVSEDLYAQVKAVDWSTVTQDLGAVENSMDMIDETINNTASSSLESLKNQFSLVLEGIFLPLLEKVTPMLQSFATWIGENETLVGTLATIIGGVLTAAVIAFTYSVIAANIALLANPILWITLGIIALITVLVLLVQNWDAVQVVVSRFFTDLKEGWSPILLAVGQWFTDLGTSIAGFFQGIWTWLVGLATSIADFFVGIWNSILNFFTVAGEKIGEVSATVVNTINSWLSAVGGFFTGIWTAVSTFFGMIGSAVATVWNTIIGTITGVFSTIQSTIQGAFKWATDAVNGLINGVRSGFTAVGDFLLGVAKSIANAFLGGINSAISGINTVLGLINSIKINVPSWVPVIGGKSWGMNVPMIPQIPMLATGADVMGATIAMIGENRPERVIDRGVGNENLQAQTDLINAVLRGDLASSSGQQGRAVNIGSMAFYGVGDMDEDKMTELVEKIQERVGWEDK